MTHFATALSLALLMATPAAAAPTQPRLGFDVDGQRGRLVIVRVIPDSPAAAAGLRVGDVIVGYFGHQPRVQSAWSWTLDAVRHNERNPRGLKLAVAREGEDRLVTVAIAGGTSPLVAGEAARPWAVGPKGRHFFGYGLGIDDGELATCQADNDCVVVKRVFARSSAQREGVVAGDRVVKYAGMRPADYITRYGDQGLERALNELRGQAEPDRRLPVTLFRPGAGEYVVELIAGWVVDPVTAPPPACEVDADAIAQALAHACRSDADCAQAQADAKAQLRTVQECVASAPAEHQPALSARLVAARAVVEERAGASARIGEIALPDTACQDAPDLSGVAHYRVDLLFERIGDLARQGQALACARPGQVRPQDGWATAATMIYLARSEYAGHDPLTAALGVNLYARVVAPGASALEKRANGPLGGLIAGYERLVSAAEMKAALRGAFAADVAARLSAGVDVGLAAARAAGPEAGLWAGYDAYAAALGEVSALLREVRAGIRTGDPAAMLARLDEARQRLLAAAKDRGAALASPAFRALSGLARAVATVHKARRPFEQALPEPLLPAAELVAAPGDVDQRVKDFMVQGHTIGRDMARADEWRAGSSWGKGAKLFVLPIKRVQAGKDGTTTLTLNNREQHSYGGQCRTVLVFIDAAGQGWGKEKCSAGGTTTVERGPARATVPTDQLAAAKNGAVIELVTTDSGSEGHPIRVWDGKMKRILAVGPFAL